VFDTVSDSAGAVVEQKVIIDAASSAIACLAWPATGSSLHIELSVALVDDGSKSPTREQHFDLRRKHGFRRGFQQKCIRAPKQRTKKTSQKAMCVTNFE
jgi:hypothetical protein